MMGTWNGFTPKQKAAAAEMFGALSALDTLNDSLDDAGERPRRIGFSDLYAYATRADSVMDDTLRRALDENQRLRQDLHCLLGKGAIHHFPRVAAASSGAVENREGDGFRIRLKQSRAVDTQTYVIIELAEGQTDTPTTLFVGNPDKEYVKQALPEAQDRTIQLLVESDSELVAALRDVQMEVFLR
jgi:hypothetical protein